MKCSAPEFLLFLPILVILGWRYPQLGFHRPLRAIALILITLCFCQPRIGFLSAHMDLWVLIDRSDSARSSATQSIDTWLNALEQSRRSHDTIHYLDFAESPIVRPQRNETHYPAPTHRTRLASALHFALAQKSPHRFTRILALTDGLSTEPLHDLKEILLREATPLDYRLFPQSPNQIDFEISPLNLPARINPTEPFLIEAQIKGTIDSHVLVEIRRNDQLLHTEHITIQNGRGILRWADRQALPGAYHYTCTLLHPHDTIQQNNRSSQWIQVQGNAGILLLTPYKNQDPIAAALQAQGLRVIIPTSTSTLTAGHLTGVRAVIIHNLSSAQINRDFLEAIPFFVQEQGGGLCMIGGKNSFGSGGYFESPIDPLLPVSIELRNEHRKIAVAIAIALDRSGSMSAGVGGGTNIQKMDLANEGTARTIELLGEQDAIAVYAVDTEPHEIVPISVVGKNRKPLLDRVRRIQSSGGGIFVYPALQAAHQALEKVKTIGQRHIILFADASDAVEARDYKKLLETLQKEKITVSVIGLGSDADSDAALLRDIAERGGGRIFFNDNATQLPALFAQETVTLSRSTFVEEPTPTLAAPGWLEIASRPLPWLNEIDGYNLCYLRPGASVGLLTEDEYKAPLVAFGKGVWGELPP